MHPILARYGPFFLYSYTVVMAIGLAAGIALTAKLAQREQGRWPGWIDGLIVALLFGLVGGRAGFVLANRTYFAEEPGQIGLVWQGGLSYHGALLAGLLGLLIWTVWRRRSFAEYAGLMAAALVLVSAFGWLACYLEGCAYGREATFGFLVSDLPDSFGVFGLRYQTHLMGLVLCLALFPVAIVGRRYLRPGLLFGISLVLLSIIRLIVSLFRGDEAPYLGSLRWDTVLDGAIVIITLSLLLVAVIIRQLRDQKPT
jgi:phosphatidylglycerol:prolipoprotein diacylglycerol transferase